MDPVPALKNLSLNHPRSGIPNLHQKTLWQSQMVVQKTYVSKPREWCLCKAPEVDA
jgi:hypothetical protein